jgi:hypothetical protein
MTKTQNPHQNRDQTKQEQGHAAKQKEVRHLKNLKTGLKKAVQARERSGSSQKTSRAGGHVRSREQEEQKKENLSSKTLFVRVF